MKINSLTVFLKSLNVKSANIKTVSPKTVSPKTVSLKTVIVVVCLLLSIASFSQGQTINRHANSLAARSKPKAKASDESIRSDTVTGGTIERGRFNPDDANLFISIDVPAFRLTLWQSGREIKNYPIGVGLKDYPIYIGSLRAGQVIWNPSWIVPDSEWVVGRRGVKAGDVVPPTSPLNPLGKLKIPLGYGYLIHEAKGFADLGNLVSHGCVRMLRSDLYDLAEKITTAREAGVSAADIARAKRSQVTLTAELAAPLEVDINYDTLIFEAGKLHIYADVYNRNTNTYARLQQELEANDIDPNAIDEQTFESILRRTTRLRSFVVDAESIRRNRTLTDGRFVSNVAVNLNATPPVRRQTKR